MKRWLMAILIAGAMLLPAAAWLAGAADPAQTPQPLLAPPSPAEAAESWPEGILLLAGGLMGLVALRHYRCQGRIK